MGLLIKNTKKKPRPLRRVLLFLGSLGLFSQPTAWAKVFMHVEDAIQSALPDCSVQREAHFLTDDQKAQVSKLSDMDLTSAMVVRYVGSCPKDKNIPRKTIYFDAHRVRTKPETIMVLIHSDETGPVVDRVDLLSFEEPLEYIPKDKWYQTFSGKILNPKLQIRQDIPLITGSTLTAKATTDAVRRILAIEKIIGPGKPK